MFHFILLPRLRRGMEISREGGSTLDGYWTSKAVGGCWWEPCVSIGTEIPGWLQYTPWDSLKTGGVLVKIRGKCGSETNSIWAISHDKNNEGARVLLELWVLRVPETREGCKDQKRSRAWKLKPNCSDEGGKTAEGVKWGDGRRAEGGTVSNSATFHPFDIGAQALVSALMWHGGPRMQLGRP